MISYEPLFKTMEKRGITQHDLLNIVHFDRSTFNQIRNNKSVTVNTLQSLCRILGCDVSDIVTIIPEDDWAPYVPDPSIKRKKGKQ